MKIRSIGAALVVALAFVAGAAHARAGIIVLKNGNVLVGLIEAEDVTAEGVTLRNVKVASGKLEGRQVIPRSDIRWFDRETDTLTLDYAKQYRKDPIETRFGAVLAKLCDELDRPPPPPIDWDFKHSGIQLAVVQHPLDHAKIRKPVGWNATRSGDIEVFTAPRTTGFVPRIHVFSVDAPGVEPSRQADWIREEAAKLSAQGLEIVSGGEPPKVVRGGFVTEWVTATRHGTKTVKALRHVLFRENRTWFVTAYAEEAEFGALVDGFRNVAGSLEVE